MQQHPLDRAAAAHDGAAPLRQGRQRLGHTVHAATHAPHALALHMRHQHQRGRSDEGRRAAISGITSEQLLQARVMEVLAQGAPQVLEGRDAQHVGQAAPAGPPQQRQRRGTRTAQERPLQRLGHALCAHAEVLVAPCLLRACKVGQGMHGRFAVGQQIETAAVGPGVARQHVAGLQVQGVVEPRAGVIEQRFEHPAHGEYRRASVHGLAGHMQLAHLAAHRGRALEHQHRQAAGRQANRCSQAAHAGAHHDHRGLTCGRDARPVGAYRRLQLTRQAHVSILHVTSYVYIL